MPPTPELACREVISDTVLTNCRSAHQLYATPRTHKDLSPANSPERHNRRNSVVYQHLGTIVFALKEAETQAFWKAMLVYS